MLRAQNKVTAAFTVFCRMPLLTELGSRKDGFCYKHGAPSGAVPAGSGSIPLKTRKNLYGASDSTTPDIEATQNVRFFPHGLSRMA
jgi:hypothetical protein